MNQLMEEMRDEFIHEAIVEVGNKSNRPKSVRHRKKNYYNAIRKQMEFYFGDANLSKDRFLRQLIEKDRYVPLETFMTFNKVKKLAKSVADIAKAIKTSDHLELNADSTGVCRRAEIPEVHDADDRTIYVEHLPQDADHDWVIRVFGRFGPVAYVSLPKYAHSKKIKEFGFVEFESSGAVEKALKAFSAFSGVLGLETTPPEKLASVTSYIKEQKMLSKGEESEKDKENEGAASDTSSTDSLQPPAKRIKISDVDTPTSELECAEVKAKKKKRKHRSRSKLIADLDRDGVPDITHMKVATKKEWKRLRNKYLNLQREKMSELKKHLSGLRGPKTARSNAPRLPIHRRTHNMNFYQDRDKGADKEIDEAAKTGKERAADKGRQVTSLPRRNTPVEDKPMHYESGLIVQVRLLEPCVDVKGFKAEMRQYEQVKYVDVKEGGTEAFIRCESRSASQNFRQQIACAEYSCEILSGSGEEQYWHKIMQDRADKIDKKVKVQRRRGREKIKQKAPNHLRFDDEE